MLRALAPLTEERRIILIGGQAVAWWARYLSPRDPGLPLAQALASKDIDFAGSIRSVEQAGKLLSADVRIPEIDDHTPNTGVIVFLDSDGIKREIDFITSRPVCARRT